jgi:hypothetical protein
MIFTGLREFSTKPFTEERGARWTMRVPSTLCRATGNIGTELVKRLVSKRTPIRIITWDEKKNRWSGSGRPGFAQPLH